MGRLSGQARVRVEHAGTPATEVRGLGLHPMTMYGLIGLFAALGLAGELACLVRPDMSFLLFAAERVLDGAVLYRDVVEINPPMIVALNLPVVFLGRLLGIDDVLVFRVLTAAGMAGVLWLCAKVISRAVTPDQSAARWLLIWLGFVLFLMPGISFGEREHLLFALVLPYVLASIGRAKGSRPGPAVALAVGILAGVAFALKPQFVMLWAALESYLAIRLRGKWRVSMESVAVVAVLAICGIATLLLAPDYVPMVRLLGRTYFHYLSLPFWEVFLTGPGMPLCLTAALILAAFSKMARHPDSVAILGVSLAATYLAGAIQLKGFPYHFYPATAFAVLLIACILLDADRPRTLVTRLYGAVAVATLGAALLIAVGWSVTRIIGRDPIDLRDREIVLDLRDAIRRHANHGGVFIFSNNLGSVFPLVRYSGLEYASRLPHLWIMAAEYHEELLGRLPIRYRERSEMDAPERYLNDVVHEDLARWSPEVILVLRPAADRPPNLVRRLDYLTYFMRDPRIAAILRQYTFAEESGEYDLYVRSAPGVGVAHPLVGKPGTLDVIQSEARGARALVANRGVLAAMLVFGLLFVVALALRWPGEWRRS
jgi:hypothetical protein